MNKKFEEVTGVSREDYLKWCKENNKIHYRPETKQLFFMLIQEGKIKKDSKTNNLIFYEEEQNEK